MFGNDAAYGPLEPVSVPGSGVPSGRRAWEWRPEGDAPSLAILFLDAELYVERVEAVPVLRSAREAGGLPPSVALFLSCVGPAERHRDYACREDYTSFLADEVVPWLLRRNPPVAPDRVLLSGLSLSGLAAAHAALARPEAFRAAICQSPSLWWEDERFRKAPPSAAAPARPLWISVGSGETERGVAHAPTGMYQGTSQIDSCRRGAEVLEERGHRVRFRVFEGGHDPACWREDLALALPWAAGPD